MTMMIMMRRRMRSMKIMRTRKLEISLYMFH